ncbi:MAG: YraN family protein [Clostridiales bacterium]|nr:YraN family protein [Clostridiales bacterium]
MNRYNIKKGKWGEDKAEAFLKKKGYSIIERNYRCRWGEIDIIAERDGTIHFVEVKTRTSDRFGSPLEAVTHEKMHHIMRTAQYYIYRNSLEKYEMSLDGIAVCEDRIDFVQGINM